VGQQHPERGRHQHGQQRLLRADLRTLVPGRIGGGALELRGEQRLAGGFPAYPLEQPGRRGSRLRAGTPKRRRR
jgi:hypothetical protein